VPREAALLLIDRYGGEGGPPSRPRRVRRFGALTRSHPAEARAEVIRTRRRMAERVGFGPVEPTPINDLRAIRCARTAENARKPPSWNDSGTVPRCHVAPSKDRMRWRSRRAVEHVIGLPPRQSSRRRERELDVRAWRCCYQSRADTIRVLLNQAPISREQDHDRESPTREVLLMAQVLICGDEHLKAFRLRRVQ